MFTKTPLTFQSAISENRLIFKVEEINDGEQLEQELRKYPIFSDIGQRDSLRACSKSLFKKLKWG